MWDRNFNYVLASDILSYLHSQGAVIKVGGELPQNPHELHKRGTYYYEIPDLTIFNVYNQAQQDMLNAGYVAVEPLIGGKKRKKDG